MVQDDNLAWLSTFPDLAKLDEPAKVKLKQHARIVEAPIGAIGYRDRSLQRLRDALGWTFPGVQNLRIRA